MQALAKMQKLHTLNINQCKHISDAGAAALAASASLRDVSVLKTSITSTGLWGLQEALGLQPAPFSPSRLRLAK